MPNSMAVSKKSFFVRYEVGIVIRFNLSRVRVHAYAHALLYYKV